MDENTVLDHLANDPHAVGRLARWSTNYDARTGSPLGVFLDLIGYSQENYGEPLVADPPQVVGYLEADMIGDALKEYADNPEGVRAWIDRLMELEGEG